MMKQEHVYGISGALGFVFALLTDSWAAKHLSSYVCIPSSALNTIGLFFGDSCPSSDLVKVPHNSMLYAVNCTIAFLAVSTLVGAALNPYIDNRQYSYRR